MAQHFSPFLGGEQKETKRLFWRYGQAGVGRDGTLLEGSKSESILKAKWSEHVFSRWWCQILFFFTPNLEEMIQFDYFSDGLVQPSTSLVSRHQNLFGTEIRKRVVWLYHLYCFVKSQQYITFTLPETNSLHLKMDGWNTILSFWEGLFSGDMLVLGCFGEGTPNWCSFLCMTCKECKRLGAPKFGSFNIFNLGGGFKYYFQLCGNDRIWVYFSNGVGSTTN